MLAEFYAIARTKIRGPAGAFLRPLSSSSPDYIQITNYSRLPLRRTVYLVGNANRHVFALWPPFSISSHPPCSLIPIRRVVPYNSLITTSRN
jgi:hypothetical protein